jgi:hypothetical protein
MFSDPPHTEQFPTPTRVVRRKIAPVGKQPLTRPERKILRGYGVPIAAVDSTAKFDHKGINIGLLVIAF